MMREMRTVCGTILAAAMSCAASAEDGGAKTEMLPSEFDGKTPVVVETKAFKLVINPDATAKSLVLKSNGEEILEPREGIPVFASTQTRPFNNEIRLVQQAKRTTYPANRVRRDGDLIRVGFETAPYEIAVLVEETDEGYATFRPERLISNTVQEHQYLYWNMDVPPVDSFRVLQLPVKNRENFGDWLNVMWDERGCAAVIGGTSYMDVDNEKRFWGRLTRQRERSACREGLGAAATAASTHRCGGRMTCAQTILSYLKSGGFRMLLVNYSALIKDGRKYARVLHDYSWGNGWGRESFSAGAWHDNQTPAHTPTAGVAVGYCEV